MPSAGEGARGKPDRISVGDHFSKQVTFTAESIRQFADHVGDTNPLHHDEAAATASSFGGMIASGTHTFSMMLAAVPDYLATRHSSLGLEASVRMRRPVRAGAAATIEWEITDISQAPKLKGWIVTMDGRLVPEDGIVAMTAVSKSLIYWPCV